MAAQARLYSDAKLIFASRVAAVFLLALMSAAVALMFPSLRIAVGAGGGVFVLVLSIVIGSVEKWVRMRAVATQEQFDTHVFQLPWNGLHVDRAPQHIVATAARRYRDSRDKDWYGDTKDTHRPFDVLICQSSNLGWGVRMHLLWAWVLIVAVVLLIVLIGLIWWVLRLSGAEGFAALVLPCLGPFKEMVEQIKANFESARAKESAERKLGELWDNGMKYGLIPNEQDLRSIQDKIVVFRQANPYIPDRFDRIFRRSNEDAMQATVADRVAQARHCGHAG